MKALRLALTIVVAFAAGCTLRLVVGWISDANEARSEQLKQNHFIACVLPPASAAPSYRA